jgi:hypothetical protein
MQIGQILRIAMFDPILALKSRRYSRDHQIGVGATQLTHDGNAFTNIKTKKVTIGGVGVPGCDFNFATAANTTAQHIDLGAIVPPLARVLDVKTHTEVAFAGTSLSALVMTTGNVSAGAQFIASASIMAKDAITAANLSSMNVAPNKDATKVYCGGTPTGANWAAITAGRVAIYITYIEP